MDPWVKNPQAARVPGPYREGDRVSFLFGSERLEGPIIEDRGNLGYQGRRLYRIRAEMGPDSEDMEITLPADFLTLVAQAPGKSGNGRADRRKSAGKKKVGGKKGTSKARRKPE